MDVAAVDRAADVAPSWSQAVAQFVRAPLLAVTFVFVLLGMAAAGPPVSVARHALIILGALAFHVAVYVANDIVDLPIDRTEPRRATSPLVRGTIGVASAGWIAFASGALAVGLAALAAPRAAAAMAVAVVLLWVYDVWGKRCPAPPLTDLGQGVGWAALVWYGSDAARHATGTTAWLGVYVVVSILLVNGVHGAVRDLVNDDRHGARTTALWMGATAVPTGAWSIPGLLWAYAVALHTGAVAVLVGAIVADGRPVRWAEIAVVVIVGAACLGGLCLGLARAGQPDVSTLAGFAYIIGMLLLPAVLVVDQLRGATLLAVVVLFAGPWANSTYVRTTVRRRRPRPPIAGPA